MRRTGATTVPPSGAFLEPTEPTDRLAELVAALTDCPGPLARDAVTRCLPPEDDNGPASGLSADERLGVVASAMVRVRHDLGAQPRRRPA